MTYVSKSTVEETKSRESRRERQSVESRRGVSSRVVKSKLGWVGGPPPRCCSFSPARSRLYRSQPLYKPPAVYNLLKCWLSLPRSNYCVEHLRAKQENWTDWAASPLKCRRGDWGVVHDQMSLCLICQWLTRLACSRFSLWCGSVNTGEGVQQAPGECHYLFQSALENW